MVSTPPFLHLWWTRGPSPQITGMGDRPAVEYMLWFHGDLSFLCPPPPPKQGLVASASESHTCSFHHAPKGPVLGKQRHTHKFTSFHGPGQAETEIWVQSTETPVRLGYPLARVTMVTCSIVCTCVCETSLGLRVLNLGHLHAVDCGL